MSNGPGNVFVSVRDREGDLIEGGWVNTIEAIVRLQDAIAKLRSMAAPTFDASWGEQPPPVLGNPNAMPS
jgi:hypothetical protein